MRSTKKAIVLGVAILSASSLSHAGLVATTAHSRANCVNNESITWWLGHSFNWRVASTHYASNGGYQHVVDTGFEYTWRSAAVHWGEAYPGNSYRWQVTGYHFIDTYGNGRVPFDITYATDCSIYDGWWDH